MSWDTEAIGARQQLETAKKLRELSMQAPQGQMVGNVFVAPHWTQHLAHALRGIDVDRRENEVLNRLESADREKNLATIQAMNAAGLEAPQALLSQAQEKPIQPGMIDRFSAFLRGEEAKPTQPQAIQQNIAKNLTPEQKEAALMQVSFVNPEVGKSLIDHEISKRKLEEANADRDALRQFQADKFASMYGVNPGEMGAIVGGRQILGNGQVVTLPKVGSGSSAGSVAGQSTGGGSRSGGTNDPLWTGKVRSGDIIQGVDGQGNPILINKNTGQINKLDGVSGFGKVATDKPMTDEQAKSSGFGARMAEAEKDISEVGTNYQPMAVNTSRAVEDIPLVGWGANALLSPESQRIAQAQRNWINANLRKESGATIQPVEFSNANRQYFPQPGDSKEVIDQKRRNRELAQRKMLENVPEKYREPSFSGSPAPESKPAPSGFKIIGVE